VDHCPHLPKPPAELTLEPQYRTTNQQTEFGSIEDFYRFNPWRAPGQAPVFDPCGMAGGAPVRGFNAAEYNETLYAKQGDLGSKVLKPRPSGTVWPRGELVRVRWQQSANHGGGYIYRLCPSNETLSEACFAQTPLEFANDVHWLRYADASKDVASKAAGVKSGGGKGWMRWPFPNYAGGQCNYVVQPPDHCQYDCPGCKAPLFSADSACPCDCEKQYPGLPPGNTDRISFPDPNPHGGDAYHDFSVEDTLRVPTHIPAGDYVLGWRWDAEMTSQIWQSCSDLTII